MLHHNATTISDPDTKRGDFLSSLEWSPGTEDVSLEDAIPRVLNWRVGRRPPGRVFGLRLADDGSSPVSSASIPSGEYGGSATQYGGTVTSSSNGSVSRASVSYGARVSTSYGGSVSTAYGGRVDRVNQLSAEQEAEKLGAALVDAYSTANGDPVGTGMRTSLQRYLMYEAILMRVAFRC